MHRRYFIVVCLMWSVKGLCSPWVGTLEPQLHQDLQILSEWGVLDAAVTTYPVPWKGIAVQLEKLQTQDMPAVLAMATQRLKHYMRVHKKQDGQSVFSLYGASDDSRITDFNATQAQKVKFNVSREFYAGRWAGQVSVNHERGGKKHFDQSFLAYQFGNWNVRFGSLSQFWGPAQTSSLILSNNARPIPSLSFSRSQSIQSPNKWLQHLGPWYFTTQLGQLESERHIADAKMWASRFNFKPATGLEIGFSWTAIWGGKSKSNGLDDWFDVIRLQSDCAIGDQHCKGKVGNHLAGFDFKYSTILFKQPFSFYGQRVGETADGDYVVSDNANLLGLSSYIGGSKIFIESSDTNVECAQNQRKLQSCYYEHDNYKSGYRYYERAIGSTFDRDAKVLTAGITKTLVNGDSFELLIAKLKLAKTEHQSTILIDGLREKILRLSGYYQTHFGDWLIKVGANIERGKRIEKDPVHDILVFTEVKYRIN